MKNKRKLLLLGLILGLSLMLASCLDSAPGEDINGETKVWNTYDNGSSFSVKYKSGWQTYEYKDGQAGFVRYQGTAAGHDQYSSLAETMAKSFQFK